MNHAPEPTGRPGTEIERRATTPIAGAIAGMLFAVLFGVAVVLIRITMTDLAQGTVWPPRRPPRSLRERVDALRTGQHLPVRAPDDSVALVLLVVVTQVWWVILVFPAWVVLVSAYILVGHLPGGRGPAAPADP